ncbi:MAG TPA: AMP-binding protein [Gammaproteobacteria bacterium]
MRPYTRLVSSLLFPLHERLKGHSTVAVRRDLEKTQWWSPERLRELQLQRLQALLRHAQAEVPYYRRLFEESGLDSTDIQALDDLCKLPFLDKPLIRAHQEELRSAQARGLARFNTGGSSGEPLIFFIGKNRVSHDVAAKWRATRWWDVDIGDPEMVVWGSPIELGSQDRIRYWRDRMLRTHLLAAFEMSEAKLDEFVRAIRRVRPRMLFGYPSALAHIARHAHRQGQSMDDLGIRVAFVTSERLYDHQREEIERVFACPVANGYGGRDAGFIAHACPRGSMHITAEDIIVEIVDAHGEVLPAGQSGEIVVTHLATADYPFIRYRTGDIGVLSDASCSCGRGLPVLRAIEGRSTDFIVAQDGTLMHGLSLIYIVRDIPGVANFKVIQESLEHTRFLLVTEAGFDPARSATIQAEARARLGDAVRVDVELVPEIPAEASGKFRYVVSRVVPATVVVPVEKNS